MDIEKQVISLYLAKKLRSLNVKQDSLFYWVKIGLNVVTCEENWRIELLKHNLTNIPDYYISAFTVAELGKMLPDWTETVKRMKDDWVCIVRHKHNDINDHSFADNEANARAKMLIYLLENGFIKND